MEIDRLNDSELNDEQVFPKLTDEQIDSIRPFGKEVDLPPGMQIYKREKGIAIFASSFGVGSISIRPTVTATSSFL